MLFYDAIEVAEACFAAAFVEHGIVVLRLLALAERVCKDDFHEMITCFARSVYFIGEVGRAAYRVVILRIVEVTACYGEIVQFIAQTAHSLGALAFEQIAINIFYGRIKRRGGFEMAFADCEASTQAPL